ncbi:uncharacterized protein LOC101858075 [Aplysia californica]|uniref:Uncharacterized protein LOC101858075 n=1 Tax=Aplysia californica TaxID=6500 RepID=A0ABM0JAF3_APLCA|nr:uncharacterized protein LOC101858075 [Aplysia californica]
MFYKFNSITQNLTSASQDVSMGRPVSVQGLSSSIAETPKTFYDFKQSAVPKKAEARQMSQSAVSGKYPVPNNSAYKKLMALQTRFTAADGKLVWQKLPKDMPLYYLSVGLVSAGVLLTFYTLKQMATPPKNE